MIRFIEVVNQTNFNPRMERTSHPRFTLEEIWINEEYVVNVREAMGYRSLLREGHLPKDLDESHAFASITTHNGGKTETHVVVGSPTTVATRLKKGPTNLLKG